MHHCIASYIQTAMRGEFFGWHLNYQGEHATLGICRNFQGGWRVSEIRTACNGKPGPELEKYVHNWAYHSEQKRIRSAAWQQVTRALRQRELRLAVSLLKGVLRLYFDKKAIPVNREMH
ncbi:MAG: hypothetical protein IBX50_16115 [Marinospirillum sp.]|nr:hypothetical protein [Marinospirillum sp.]